MAIHMLDCSHVEEGDYEVRYVQGALTDAEAEAYEAHYFGCDRCWSSLQRALELRAVFTEDRDAAAPSDSRAPAAGKSAEAAADAIRLLPDTGKSTRRAPATPTARTASRRQTSTLRWWPMAAAAALIIAAVGTWRLRPGNGELSSPIDAERGRAAVLQVRPITGPDSIGASWSPVPGAESYHVRLYSPDGTVFASREIPDTSLSVARATLGSGSLAGGAFWSVEAFDGTNRSLGRSRLTPAGTLPPQ